MFSTWWTKPQGEDRTFLLTAEEVSKELTCFLIWAGSLLFYFNVVIRVIIAAISNDKLLFCAPILTGHLLTSFFFPQHHNVQVSDVLQLSPAAGCFDSVISKITARSLTGSGHSDHPKQLRRGSRLSLSQDSNSGPKEVKIEPTAKPTRPRFNGG